MRSEQFEIVPPPDFNPMMALTDQTKKRFYSPVFNFGFGKVRGAEVLP
ncbi:hypothetical protein H6G97_44820 [Nostoc flagelliforme FACHB-838]|uniref:Uncharacterized protein n=1 Tax=Nostoc flagelliforme FACHB-838 TaxID=2692904 RepID=A0ABR8E4P5_9NOSO|nr:hypothetical protein [Nostoc flagelliforme]MBD2536066.1 hypothetical protein [Nostoc flagelliforme FACHB-838]